MTGLLYTYLNNSCRGNEMEDYRVKDERKNERNCGVQYKGWKKASIQLHQK